MILNYTVKKYMYISFASPKEIKVSLSNILYIYVYKYFTGMTINGIKDLITKS